MTRASFGLAALLLLASCAKEWAAPGGRPCKEEGGCPYPFSCDMTSQACRYCPECFTVLSSSDGGTRSDGGGMRPDAGPDGPPPEAWRPMASAGAPPPVAYAASTWTGSELILVGGQVAGQDLPGAAYRYDPARDAWSSTTASPEAGRSFAACVWTGRALILVGGGTPLELTLPDAMGRWRPLPAEPTQRNGALAVWTGSEVVVTGSSAANEGEPLLDLYDPSLETWRSSTPATGSVRRDRAVMVWTGTEVLVWGGGIVGGGDEGGLRFDPASGMWRAMTTAGAPPTRPDAVAAWTGDRLMIWAGDVEAPGGLYDPATDTWAAIGTPVRFTGARAVWAGRGLAVVGGTQGLRQRDVGGSVPVELVDKLGTVVALPAFGSPTEGHVLQWTGSELLLFGGASMMPGRPAMGASLGGRLRIP